MPSSRACCSSAMASPICPIPIRPTRDPTELAREVRQALTAIGRSGAAFDAQKRRDLLDYLQIPRTAWLPSKRLFRFSLWPPQSPGIDLAVGAVSPVGTRKRRGRVHDLIASYAMLHPDGQQSIRQPRGRFGFFRRRPGTSQSARHRIAIGCILHSGGLRRSESRSAGVAASRPGTLLHGILVHPLSTPPSYPVPLPDYP